EEPKNRKWYLFLTWLSYLLAIFTKESGVFYILLLPLYDLCMRRISFRTLLSRDYTPNLVVPIIFFVFYLLLRWNAIGEMIGADKLYGQVPISERIVQIPGLFTKYLSLLLFPWHLSIVHPADQLIWVNFPFNMLAFLITLFIIGGIVISWRKNPLICFCLLWLGVGLLPALNIFPLAVQILEHRLYVPSVGFVLIITFGVNNLLTKIHWMNGYRYALVAILLIYGYLSYIRLPIWQNSETLWTDVIEKAPNSSRAYFNLAGYYFEQQQYEKTIDMLKKYLPLKPNDFLGYSKLRQTYFIMGRYDQAADVCRQMIALNPRNENRYIETGKFFEQLNMIDSAKAIYLEGLLVDSNFAELHYHLGRLYEYEDNLVLAEHEYHRVIGLEPSHALAYFDLGRLLVRKNDYHLAISTIEKGMQFATPSKEVLRLLSTLYISTGNEQKAQELSQRFSDSSK
ncbi:MAG TPA: tetratricopeptide repeat protein, partial [Bacteroidota bacterium]|nr:tetratricopeptide repeat protein [Bacteroidota bacterium]